VEEIKMNRGTCCAMADIAVDHLYPWTLRSLEGSNVE